jgi:hypothetical protein
MSNLEGLEWWNHFAGVMAEQRICTPRLNPDDLLLKVFDGHLSIMYEIG